VPVSQLVSKSLPEYTSGKHMEYHYLGIEAKQGVFGWHGP